MASAYGFEQAGPAAAAAASAAGVAAARTRGGVRRMGHGAWHGTPRVLAPTSGFPAAFLVSSFAPSTVAGLNGLEYGLRDMEVMVVVVWKYVPKSVSA